MQRLSEKIKGSGFTLALFMLSGVALLSYRTVQQLTADVQWEAHTYRVLSEIDTVSHTVEHLQQEQREYLLTDNRAALRSYDTTKKDGLQAFAAIRRLTQDNSVQQRQLDRIEPSLAQWVRSLDRAVAQPNQLPLSSVMAATQADQQRQQNLLRVLAEMEMEEQRLLQQRLVTSSDALQDTLFLTGLGYVLSFGLLIAIYQLLQREIRDRQQAERLVKKRSEEIYDLYNNAPCGYHSIDAYGTVLNINDTGLKWLGYSRDEVVNRKKFTELITPQSQLVFDDCFAQFKCQGWINNVEFDLICKDNSILPVSLNATAITDAAGNFVMSRSTLFNIRDRRQAELALRQLNEELKRSNQELEQFAYVASHDLQEPLRAVIAYTQLLEQDHPHHLDPRSNQYMAFVIDGATRMQQLIQDLLIYSRVGQRSPRSQTDCNAVLQQVLANLQVAIAESHATITADPLPVVNVDPLQLSQIFQNLVGNAIKFRRAEPPCIHIAAIDLGSEFAPSVPTTQPIVSASPQWLFSVQDNGIGMKTQYLDRIFEIFKRLHTRREFSGTGIGLAICKKIVEHCDGVIWADSQPGIGTTFYFTLPKTGCTARLDQSRHVVGINSR